MSSTRSAREGVASRARSASSCAVQRSQCGRKTSPSRASARSPPRLGRQLQPHQQARVARRGARARTDALDDQELGRLERPRLGISRLDPVVAGYLHAAARGERLEHGAHEQLDALLEAVPPGIELLELDDRAPEHGRELARERRLAGARAAVDRQDAGAPGPGRRGAQAPRDSLQLVVVDRGVSSRAGARW